MKSINKKLAKKNEYDCCAHYYSDTYLEGYVMIPTVKVEVCCNCGGVRLTANAIWSFIFMHILRYFWTGHVWITGEADNGSNI